MAWFITNVDPGLTVTCSDKRVVAFRDAEYRTADPVELSALRADPRVGEVKAKVPTGPLLRPWAVNVETGTIHNLVRAGTQCHIPNAVQLAGCAEETTPEGWHLYRREQDAKRWNRDATLCRHCGSGDVV